MLSGASHLFCLFIVFYNLLDGAVSGDAQDFKFESKWKLDDGNGNTTIVTNTARTTSTGFTSPSTPTSTSTSTSASTTTSTSTKPTTPAVPTIRQCGHDVSCPSGPDQHHCCPEGEVFQCLNYFGDNWICDCPPGFFLDDVTEQCKLADAVYTLSLNISMEFQSNDLYNASSEKFAVDATNITQILQSALNNSLYSARVKSFTTSGLRVTTIANVILTARSGVSSKTLLESVTAYLGVCSSLQEACFIGQNATLVSKSFASHLPCEYTCPGDTTCVNKTGTAPSRCICKTGFFSTGTESHLTDDLAVDICKDIDECADSTNQCGAADTCINTPGSHVCLCQDDYSYNATSNLCVANTICSSSRNPCKHGGACKASGPGAHDYLCTCDFPYDGKECESYVTLILLVLLIVFGALCLLLSILITVWIIRKCLERQNVVKVTEQDGGDIPGFATVADLQNPYGGKQPFVGSATAPPLRQYTGVGGYPSTNFNEGDEEMRMLRWLGNSTTPLNEDQLRSGGMLPKRLAVKGGQARVNSAFLPPPAPLQNDDYGKRGGRRDKKNKKGRNNYSPYFDTPGTAASFGGFEQNRGAADASAPTTFGGYDNSGYMPRKPGYY